MSKKYANIYKQNKCKCIKIHIHIYIEYIYKRTVINAKLITKEHYKPSRNINIHRRNKKKHTHSNIHRVVAILQLHRYQTRIQG